MSLPSFLLLGSCVFFAGIVDALAGGGGLLTLPAYLASGLSPAFVLGTNKLSSSLGTFVATARYHQALRYSLRDFLPVMVATIIASWLGARLTLIFNPHWLRLVILLVMPVIAWLVWSHKNFGQEDQSHHLSRSKQRRRGLLVAAPIGLYDGFFGPGAGTFYTLGLVRLGGYDFLAATARAKMLNLLSNLGALIAFSLAGRVHWHIGLPMAALGICGNWVGAHIGVQRGAKIIRPLIVLVCLGLFLRLAWDTFAR